MLEGNLNLQTVAAVILAILIVARRRLARPFRQPARIPVRVEAQGRPIQLQVRIRGNDTRRWPQLRAEGGPCNEECSASIR